MATAGDVLTRLQEKLNDLDSIRWPDAEHFRAMNDSQQAILEARPDLFEVFANVDTVAGSEQTVPADCYRLFDVVSNLSAADARVSGVTFITRGVLDRHVRNWMVMDADAEADHWMQDEREYSRFYLVPGQPSSGRGKLELRYAQKPSVITGSGDTLSAGEELINTIYNFCMHRALEKDEKFAGTPTAEAYFGKFAKFIAAKTKADETYEQVREQSEKA